MFIVGINSNSLAHVDDEVKKSKNCILKKVFMSSQGPCSCFSLGMKVTGLRYVLGCLALFLYKNKTFFFLNLHTATLQHFLIFILCTPALKVTHFLLLLISPQLLLRNYWMFTHLRFFRLQENKSSPSFCCSCSS